MYFQQAQANTVCNNPIGAAQLLVLTRANVLTLFLRLQEGVCFSQKSVKHPQSKSAVLILEPETTKLRTTAVFGIISTGLFLKV